MVAFVKLSLPYRYASFRLPFQALDIVAVAEGVDPFIDIVEIPVAAEREAEELFPSQGHDPFDPEFTVREECPVLEIEGGKCRRRPVAAAAGQIEHIVLDEKVDDAVDAFTREIACVQFLKRQTGLADRDRSGFLRFWRDHFFLDFPAVIIGCP